MSGGEPLKCAKVYELIASIGDGATHEVRYDQYAYEHAEHREYGADFVRADGFKLDHLVHGNGTRVFALDTVCFHSRIVDGCSVTVGCRNADLPWSAISLSPICE